jgi:cytochrome c oxidase subunit 4
MSAQHPTRKLYFGIWGVLMGLLVLTWGVSEVDLGQWNIVAAMSIAILKMMLVLLFFMHVKYSSRLTWIYVAAGFFWLLIMITLTMSDYLTRSG